MVISLIGALKRYFSQNSKWFLIALTVWLAASVCAVVCAAGTKGAVFDETYEYVSLAFSKKMSLGTLIKNGIVSDFKYVLFISLASSAPVLLPVTLALIAFNGFSAGFTATVIIKIYSLKGIAVSALAVVLPLSLSLPVYFLVFVSALKYSGDKMKSVRLKNPEAKKLTSHLLSQFILFGVLCVLAVMRGILTMMAQALV